MKPDEDPISSSSDQPSSLSIDMAGNLNVHLPSHSTNTKTTKKKKKQKKQRDKSLKSGNGKKKRSTQDGPKSAIPSTNMIAKTLGDDDDYSTDSDQKPEEILTPQEIQDQRTKLSASESAEEMTISTMSRSTTSTTVPPKTSLQPSSAARQNEPGAFTVVGSGGGGSTNVTTTSTSNTEPLTADVEAGPSSSEGLKIEAVAVDEDAENLRIREIEQRYTERLERLARGEDPDTGETIRSRHRRSSSFYLGLKCSERQMRVIKIVLLAVGVIAIVAIAIGLLVSGSKDDSAVVSSSNTPNDQVTSPPSNQTDVPSWNQTDDIPQCYKHDRLGETECTYVEMGTNVPNQQTSYKQVFANLILDVSTNSPFGTDPEKNTAVYEDVRNIFQSKLIPIIAGCRTIQEISLDFPVEWTAGYCEHCHPNRLMVVNGVVKSATNGGDCNSDALKPCLRIDVSLDLYVYRDSTFDDFR